MASQITDLAARIKVETDRLQSLLDRDGIPSPSFSTDAATELPRNAMIQSTQRAVLEACTELQDLVEGPLAHLVRITSPRINILTSLQAICDFKIASSMGKDEVIKYEEVAERCNMNVDDVRRFLRMAISYHIFTEPEAGYVSHTASSLLLSENDAMSQWVSLVCDEMWPTGPHIVPAMKSWPGSQEPNETAFAKANEGLAMWDVLKNDPARASRFASGMQFLQTHPAFDMNYLFTSLNWDLDCRMSMVDMGGSLGSIARALLERHPNLRCCVQDLPEVVTHAKVPPHLDGRLEFVGHSFFAEQTVRADVYLLRSVLHDWADKYAIEIIRKLTPALKEGAKIVINEVCLPEPNVMSFYDSQLVYGYDISMKQNFNSKERNAGEWERLFEQADKRFKLNRIVNPPGSILAIIEFVWQ